MSGQSPVPTHHVKVRQVGKQRWVFLTSRGGTNNLRIHAAQFTEDRAAQCVEDIHTENPGDWSGIRDSSDAAQSAMLERALNFLKLGVL